jgi:hypothetical protein
VYIYIPKATADDIANILSAQLDDMQKSGALNSTTNLTSSMTVDPLTDTHLTTYLDDEHITQTTNMMSPHLESVPHAYIVTTPTFSPATLLASRQLMYTSNLPAACIPAWGLREPEETTPLPSPNHYPQECRQA